MADAFGADYAPSLRKHLALTRLGSMTADAALESGVAPRDVWHALCDELDAPAAVRAGVDPLAIIPPRR